MATRKSKPIAEEPPPDWMPTQAVADPILNGPYDEPAAHWSYQKGVPNRIPSRRPASYWFRTQKLQTGQEDLFAEEDRDRLELVNRLRDDVKRWRESSYRGASRVTQDLFRYWFDPERERRLFFCQREAVETIVYLLEIAMPGRLGATGFKKFEIGPEIITRLLDGERIDELAMEQSGIWPTLIDRPADESLLPLRRLGCKMATGSGKTVVMALVIAWAFCNRGVNPSTRTYPNAVLIVGPNLTVRKRLQVLKPEHDANYYDQFDLVPAKYRPLLNAGKVLITNWHALSLKSEHSEGGTSYRVVEKGEETSDAFTLDRLGELAERLPILVLNDEGHHCWRPRLNARADESQLTKEEKDALKEEQEEARVWLAGLDRINNCGLIGDRVPGVLATIDLSATPFYLGASGYPEGSPFPWLVSDFGLVDAIESGITKIPRLPVLDDSSAKDDAGRPDPKYFRLWRHINEMLTAADRIGKRPKPDAIYREAHSALATLAAQWSQRFREHYAGANGDGRIPPVMIVVCDNTNIAEIVYQQISGERVVEVLGEDGKATTKVVYEGSGFFPELANSETARHTVRIDTKLLNKIETEEGETKDQAALALRELIDTVGKRGGPGEQIRCVVSVSMLTEGWDANNVTHVLGIRAFDSQLLCEQVVGRGLRRMSYDVDPETGKFRPEYVDVYGIPFSLIPFKGRTQNEKPEDPEYHRVFSVPEKQQYRIDMPIVEGYTYELRESGIRCNVDELEELILDDEPTRVYLVPSRGYEEEGAAIQAGDYVEQNREQFYANVRLNDLVFRVARLIVTDLTSDDASKKDESLKNQLLARHQIFPQILRIVREYVDRKVILGKGVTDKREIALARYMEKLRERVREGIVSAASTGKAALLPIINTYEPVATTEGVDYQTTRSVWRLAKSHLNCAVIRSSWESDAIAVLESMDAVDAYAPNDRKIGFQIPYEYVGTPHRYEPDFLVRMRGGKTVFVEIKGKKGEVHDEDLVNAKSQAAKKWCAAVNNAKRWGEWAYEICKDVSALRSQLSRHAAVVAEAYPFRFVTPSAGEHFRTCVPLTTITAAAGLLSEEQLSLEAMGEHASEWVTWDRGRPFEPGMFVARIIGKSMEPDYPDGCYVLFRANPGGSRHGKALLVRHSGVEDAETGGRFTFKDYFSEKVAAGDETWRHARITLRPRNPAYEPIMLSVGDEGDVRVLAEAIERLGLVGGG